MAQHALVPSLIANMFPIHGYGVSKGHRPPCCSPTNALDGLPMHRMNYPLPHPLGPNPPTSARGRYSQWSELSKSMQHACALLGGIGLEEENTNIQNVLINQSS